MNQYEPVPIVELDTQRQLENLRRFEEASELAYYGAEVLHPAAFVVVVSGCLCNRSYDRIVFRCRAHPDNPPRRGRWRGQREGLRGQRQRYRRRLGGYSSGD